MFKKQKKAVKRGDLHVPWHGRTGLQQAESVDSAREPGPVAGTQAGWIARLPLGI